jgi:hypothetical protein
MWFAAVMIMAAEGAFSRPPGTLPLPIFAGLGTPIIVFAIAYRAIGGFRDFVLCLDLRLVTGIQAWRFVGFGFIALYAYGVLPGSFAWSAGLGDLAVGITAPWVVLALIRRPSFTSSPLFVGWNLLGMLDLVNAMSLGALSMMLATGTAGEVTTRPMSQLPLVLIPAFAVPFLLMLHLTALIQARQKHAEGQTSERSAHDTNIAALRHAS